jgi:general secretion pathway protein K
MVDLSELLLVKGVNAEMYQTLRPYLTALPETTPLNLNTMTPELFDALKLDKSGAELVEMRETDEFSSIEDFVKRMEIVLDENQKKWLSVSTQFFLATGTVTLDDKSVTIRSLLKRDGKGQTKVLSRGLGDLL